MKTGYYICCITIALGFLQCHTKYFVYQRESTDLHEQFEISLKNGVFLYSVDTLNLKYHAKGTFQFYDSTFEFEFPENAESDPLSPFKKGYSELKKISDSNQMIVPESSFDVRNGNPLSQNRHFKPFIEIISPSDSTLIRKVDFPFTEITDSLSLLLLRSKFPEFFDQYILIPEPGEYELKLYLQPIETMVYYETTTTECYREVAGPPFYLDACASENDVITSLCVPGNSNRKYILKGTAFRKLRIF